MPSTSPDSNRVADYTRDFQNTLLIQLLWDDALADLCASHLHIDDFELPFHQITYEAFLGYYRRYSARPSLEELRSETMGLMANVHGNARTVLDDAELGAIWGLFRNIYQPGRLSPDYFRNALPAFLEAVRTQRVMDELSVRTELATVGDAARLSRELTTITDQAAALTSAGGFRTLAEDSGIVATQEDLFKIPTGVANLDMMLSGGMGIGELGMIIAVPGMGKTNALLSLSIAAATAGIDVLVLSLELNDQMIRQRLTAMLAGLSGPRVKLSRDQLFPHERQLLSFMEDPNMFPASDAVTIVDVSGEEMSPDAVLAKTKAWRQFIAEKRGSDETARLVIVDWLDYMRFHVPNGRNEYSVIPEALRHFRRGLAQIGVTCWTATQGTRDAVNKVLVDMSHTAGGYQKNAPVDVTIGVGTTPEALAAARESVSDDLYVSGADGVELTINVGKNRNGSTGHLRVYRAPNLRLYATPADYHRHQRILEQAAPPQQQMLPEGTDPDSLTAQATELITQAAAAVGDPSELAAVHARVRNG